MVQTENLNLVAVGRAVASIVPLTLRLIPGISLLWRDGDGGLGKAFNFLSCMDFHITRVYGYNSSTTVWHLNGAMYAFESDICRRDAQELALSIQPQESSVGGNSSTNTGSSLAPAQGAVAPVAQVLCWHFTSSTEPKLANEYNAALPQDFAAVTVGCICAMKHRRRAVSCELG